ncbi:MAG: hypothetical protein COV07_02000 [Candidatus Vogelbacteria bacterium CG10_big_fil_rev_8_21_14_0_10_45_14]|uniref:Uncharacterized protein n=1 Tax=Candidatus Vogelbacteria bacterium CG10_big_fil_rev_8_21_14_0_10_45_14 TaxID=1975042 RepID=A0A2H0RK51_9BACT|nr:MAG: hypothetical protein COV07_02000 [Candidatus Vogelbacteria bacterium CG10_big_fil_rev_8_21_14_0_10_45_14]
MNLQSVKNIYIAQTKSLEDLYIRVLLWAFQRQEAGFTWKELIDNFQLNSLQEIWVRKIFLTVSDHDRKFFEHLRTGDATTFSTEHYSLNEKGVTAALNYKSLAHAEKTSSSAITIATISMLLTFAGIFFQIKQTRLTEVQVIPEQINQARFRQFALEYCRENTEAQDSGMYYLDGSGKMATCSELLKMYR